MSTIQVDRIIPYQSASVTIEGDVTVLGAATTGSNTFTGDQNIQGTLTASIQEGYAWVGGTGNVSKLVATSSLSGDSFPYTGDAVISGSLTISGSSLYDLTVEGKQQIIGTVGIGAAAIPQLLISASDFNTLLSRNNIQFRADGATQNGVIGRSQLGLYAEPLQGATLLMTTYDEGFTEDVELFITVDSPSGITVQDWDNSSGQYDDIFVILPNLGTTPDVEFKRSLQVTGSVDISSVLELKGQDPLPAGGVGQLAVSSSGDLYYHNGAGWQLK